MRYSWTSHSVLFFLFLFSFAACKSDFERVRTSGNSQVMYAAGMQYYEEGEYLKAQTLFEQIVSAYKGKTEAEELYFKYAYTYYHLGQYILASYYFKNFSSTFGRSPLREEAMFMSAYSNYLLSPNFRLDQTYSKQAIDEFQTFVNTYPNSEKVEECNKLIDEMRKKLEKKAIARADLYYDMSRYQAAVQSYEIVLQDYPETSAAEKIRYQMARAQYRLAKNSVYSKRRERYTSAMELADQFLKRYSSSEYAEEILKFKSDSEEQIKSLLDG
jgi:outer membrane protein assembly factor BamD